MTTKTTSATPTALRWCDQGGGTEVRASREVLANLAHGKDLYGDALTTPWEYGQSYACPKNTGPTTSATETGCIGAERGCGPGSGPPVGPGDVRSTRPSGPRRTRRVGLRWARPVSVICCRAHRPDRGDDPKRLLHHPWAKATTSTQPKGDVSLVTLPTFFKATWQTEGFQSGEVRQIDPARMLGYPVDVRPKLVGLEFPYGDGQPFGRPTSLGGVYPNGDITHTYRVPASSARTSR